MSFRRSGLWPAELCIYTLAIALGILAASQFARATVFVIPPLPQVGPGDTSIKPGGVLSQGGAQFTGSVQTNAIGTPSAPVITNVGTAGSTTYTYACTAVDINGNATIPSATASTTTGNASLSATNFNLVSCGGQVGALLYIVHKTNTSTVLGSCYTTSNAPCTVNDTGQSTTTYTPNTVDQTGGLAGTNAGKLTCAGAGVKLVAGTLEVTAPCASNYSACNCSINQLTTPVAGELCSCGVTSTATTTIIGGATTTVTVGAVLLNIAGTPSPSPVVNYWMGPQ